MAVSPTLPSPARPTITVDASAQPGDSSALLALLVRLAEQSADRGEAPRS
jgi:hypothetical protein